VTTFRKYIHESSLSRCYQEMKEHDTGLITASRKTIKDFEQDCKVIYNVTRAQNKKRNAQLEQELVKWYGVTSVRGSYIENYGMSDAIEVGENAYFVVDLQDKRNLKKDLIRLGEKWNQDSVLYIPKNNMKGKLIGTSRCNKRPKYKEIELLSSPVFGKNGEIMTKVRGRPFIFENFGIPISKPDNWFSRMGVYAVTKGSWKDVNEYEENYDDSWKDEEYKNLG